VSGLPAKYNIQLQRRADYKLRIEINTENESPLNLTGWTVYAQCWNKERTVKYADFTIEYTDRINGVFHILLTSTQTASFPFDDVFYDILLQNPFNYKEYYLEGIVYISEGYTAP